MTLVFLYYGNGLRMVISMFVLREEYKPEMANPVSYTHLDVYKRQVWYRRDDEWNQSGND